MKQPLLSATCLLLAAFGAETTLHAQKKQTVTKKSTVTNNRYMSVENDSVASGVRIIDYRDQHHYSIRMMDDKILELIVDGNKIPEADFGKYSAAIRKIRDQIKKDEEMAEQDRKQADIDRAQANEDRKQADEDKLQADEDRKQADEDRMQADADRKQAAEDRKQADEDRAQAVKDREQAVIDRKQAEEDRILVKNLLSDLISEKIVNTESEVSLLTLRDGELQVNGQKQSMELARRFGSKYLKKPRTEIKYSNSIGHHGLSITSGDNK